MKTKCKHVKILRTTNKVANELNKLGTGKKTKNITGKGNTPHERQFEMENRGER